MLRCLCKPPLLSAGNVSPLEGIGVSIDAHKTPLFPTRRNFLISATRGLFVF